MIDLYGMSSPNVIKVILMLEEIGFPYQFHHVDVVGAEQFEPWFKALNPNSKLPVVVDSHTRMSVFESGAILIYLAERAGKFLPRDLAERTVVYQWLMLQMSGVGPMGGQAIHFTAITRDNPYAQKRYVLELNRLLDVLNTRLDHHDYLAGHAYSIADIATWPWLRTISRFFADMPDRPALSRWFARIAERSAAQRTAQIASDLSSTDRAKMGAATALMRDQYYGRIART